MSEPNYKDLEIVNNEYSDREYNIDVSVPEFNCVCPKTPLLPDQFQPEERPAHNLAP